MKIFLWIKIKQKKLYKNQIITYQKLKIKQTKMMKIFFLIKTKQKKTRKKKIKISLI